MIGILLGSACAASEVFMMVKIYQSWTWHHRGLGERTARAEYARIRREQPDTAEARLSEAEFVRYRVATRPGVTLYIVAALLLALLGLSAPYVINTLATLP